VEVIFAALIGGAGNLYGAILGGVSYMVISTIWRGISRDGRWFLGIALLILVFKFREGIWGNIIVVWKRRTPDRRMTRAYKHHYLRADDRRDPLYHLDWAFRDLREHEDCQFCPRMIYNHCLAYILIACSAFDPKQFSLDCLSPSWWSFRSFHYREFIVRRLYGESIDYAIISTYAVLLIGVDLVKWNLGDKVPFR